MDTTRFAIATIAWARDDKEEALLSQSLAALSHLGINVFVADGGSADTFLETLQRLPHLTLLKAKGLWPQAKKSIMEAQRSGAQTIFYTEPDKLEFFSHHLSSFLANSRWDEQGGVVLASRSQKAFSSFPHFQQMTETTINRCCQVVTGLTTDYCYGPFLFNADLVGELEKLPENIGWGWRPFLFATAHRLGYRVRAQEGDFMCPSDQQADNETERIYRMKQLAQNIEGLLLAKA